MKTLFTFAIALFLTSNSFAQLTPGSYVLSGGLGFGFSKTPNASTDIQNTSFRISPGIGKFISEKYLMDGGIEYSFNSQNFDQHQTNYSQKSSSHLFGLRFGVTRYFPIIDRLYFTLGAHVIPSYSTLRTQSENFGNSSDNRTSSMNARLNVAPGLTYFINKKWMLYSYVGVLNYGFTYNFDTEDVGHNLFLNLESNSFGVGVRYVLGKGTND